MAFTKAEVIKHIKDCYDKNKNQKEIAAELNSLEIKSSRKSGLWDGNAVSEFGLKNSIRRGPPRKHKTTIIAGNDKISLSTLGKLLQSENLTEHEKRKLMSALA